MSKNKYLHIIRIVIAVGVSVLAGCATVHAPWRGDGLVDSTAARQCAEHFSALDTAVERAGVRDAEAHRISEFPYLRVDRFSAHLRDEAADNGPAYAQWLSRLVALDHAARRVEISNLPDANVRALQPSGGGRAALIDTTARCAIRICNRRNVPR